MSGRWAMAAMAALAVGVAASAAVPARAATASVTIVSFGYRPAAVEVAVGDTVAWTNLDPVEHTVSADDGAFESGRLGPGQRYELTFLRPGTYRYFCQPHDFMLGTVVVTGGPSADSSAAATTSTTATAPRAGDGATTSTVAAAAGSPPATPAATAQAVPGGEPEAREAGGAGVAAPAGPVTAGGVVFGTPRGLPPLPPGAGVVALAGALAAVVRVAGRLRPERAAAVGASFLTAVSALVHLQLRVAVDYPEPTATLLFAHAAAGIVLGIHLLAPTRAVVVAGVAYHLAALVAFSASRWWSLFGFRELGWYPTPQSGLAVAAAAGSVALLVAASARRVTPPLEPPAQGARA